MIERDAMLLNPYCIIYELLKPINYEHDQNFAEKPVAHRYIYIFWINFLASKIPFSVILKISTFRSRYICILVVKSLMIFKVNIQLL